MNAVIERYESSSMEYGVETGRQSSGSGNTSFKTTNRPRFSRKRGKAPRQHNGMHRRRRKKIQW